VSSLQRLLLLPRLVFFSRTPLKLNMANMSCNALSSRTDFPGYMALLRNFTDGEFSLVETCKAEVCGALWGSGNPDISGVGMAVGYLLESSLCAVLICGHLWLRRRSGTKQGGVNLILQSAAGTFFDNAIFFAFAIQIASIVTLARANFGISADGMGAITMKIAWAVSTLTLLPLSTILLRPQMFGKDTGSGPLDHGSKNALPPTIDESTMSLEERFQLVDSRARARQDQRFLLFVICWALSFYPFFSRMAGTFGKSPILCSKELLVDFL
jgi:hypothetical protein